MGEWLAVAGGPVAADSPAYVLHTVLRYCGRHAAASLTPPVAGGVAASVATTLASIAMSRFAVIAVATQIALGHPVEYHPQDILFS